jgi:hypothetical protein
MVSNNKAALVAVSALALTLCTAVVPAWAASLPYLLNGNGPFGTIDLSTGAFTSINGSTGGINETGLGESGGTLYLEANGLSGACLDTVNPTTGNLTPVGCSFPPFGDDFGSSSSGLFMVGFDANLYSVNPSSGAATNIGPLGIVLSGFRSLSVSTDSASLFFADLGNLYSVNTSTGAATLIGPTLDSSSVDQHFGALMFSSGTLFGGSQAQQIDTISTSNGHVLTETNITPAGSDPFGLAPPVSTPPPSVPEPATLALLGSGLFALSRGRLRRR